MPVGRSDAGGLARSEYDDYAAEYAAYVAWRERHVAGDPMGILPDMLALLGGVAGQEVLDAGCGEGYLARVLAAGGARVTGIDLAPRLVDLARARDPGGRIAFRVADLSRPQPEDEARFDAIASYLVLNDVVDYRGFAATLASLLRPGGRLVLSLNSPYSAVVRGKVADYFDSGGEGPYCGLAAIGVKVRFHHRTLEEYMDAFLGAGLRLTRLRDVPEVPNEASPEAVRPEGVRLPRFMILAFTRP